MFNNSKLVSNFYNKGVYSLTTCTGIVAGILLDFIKYTIKLSNKRIWWSLFSFQTPLWLEETPWRAETARGILNCRSWPSSSSTKHKMHAKSWSYKLILKVMLMTKSSQVLPRIEAMSLWALPACLDQVKNVLLATLKWFQHQFIVRTTECDTNSSENNSTSVKKENTDFKKHLFSDAQTNTVSSSG